MSGSRAATTGAGRVVTAAFTHAAGTREYRLHLPPGDGGGRRRALILMLHGCLQGPADFAVATRLPALAAPAGACVLFPGQSRTEQASRCWRWFEAGQQRRGAGEPSLLAEMTRAVIAEQRIDPARVYVAGFSAGGAMAAVLAAAYPDLYAAGGVHSAPLFFAVRDAVPPFERLVPGAARPRAQVAAVAPLIVFHGARDRIVHPIHGERIVAWVCAERAGGEPAAVEPGRTPGGRAYTRTIHRARDGRAVAEHWLVQGAGHAWSGGSPAAAYTDPEGPDAAAAMLRFFAQFRVRRAGASPFRARGG